jgi:hypothetical protein
MTRSVKVRIAVIWAATAILLALHALGIIHWSPWFIVTPVLVLIAIITIPLCIVIWIGMYRGLKIRINNALK